MLYISQLLIQAQVPKCEACMDCLAICNWDRNVGGYLLYFFFSFAEFPTVQVRLCESLSSPILDFCLLNFVTLHLASGRPLLAVPARTSAWSIALLRFAVGGLLLGFPKSNAPKIRKVCESGRIMPLKQRILGKIN